MADNNDGSIWAALAPSGLQFLGGIAQSIIGGSKERKAENALENLQTPTYQANKSIMDYYNQALQRYNINPYQSQEYNYAMNQANAATAAGLGALQDRRSAIGGVSRLTALSNDAALRAGITAENQRTQNFAQLGSATGMKAADDRYRFQINDLMPYEKQYSLLAAKAGGGANVLNAGLQNIFGGLSSGSMIASDQLLNPSTTTNNSTDNYNYGWNIPSSYGTYQSNKNYFQK